MSTSTVGFKLQDWAILRWIVLFSPPGCLERKAFHYCVQWPQKPCASKYTWHGTWVLLFWCSLLVGGTGWQCTLREEISVSFPLDRGTCFIFQIRSYSPKCLNEVPWQLDCPCLKPPGKKLQFTNLTSSVWSQLVHKLQTPPYNRSKKKNTSKSWTVMSEIVLINLSFTELCALGILY